MDLIASRALAQVVMGNVGGCEILKPDRSGPCGYLGDHLYLVHSHVAHRNGSHTFKFRHLRPPKAAPGSLFPPAQPCYNPDGCARCLTAVVTWNGTCVLACPACAQLRARGVPNNPRVRFATIQNVEWLRDHPALLPIAPFPHYTAA